MMHDVWNEPTLLLNVICEVVEDNVVSQVLASNSHLQMSCFGCGNGHFKHCFTKLYELVIS